MPVLLPRSSAKQDLEAPPVGINVSRTGSQCLRTSARTPRFIAIDATGHCTGAATFESLSQAMWLICHSQVERNGSHPARDAAPVLVRWRRASAHGDPACSPCADMCSLCSRGWEGGVRWVARQRPALPKLCVGRAGDAGNSGTSAACCASEGHRDGHSDRWPRANTPLPCSHLSSQGGASVRVTRYRDFRIGPASLVELRANFLFWLLTCGIKTGSSTAEASNDGDRSRRSW